MHNLADADTACCTPITMTRETCRLIVDSPARGTWNMAVDEALLEAAVVDAAVENDGHDRRATLRLYQWNEPTLSLGYFQHFDDRLTHAASRDSAIVRRQSGGGAILHDRELTYSLILPPAHRLTRDATALYTAVHTAFVEVLTPLLARSAASEWRLALNDCQSQLRKSDEPFLCFQRRACGDLLLNSAGGPDDRGKATISATRTYKILGSAQRRHRGAILQHGSFLISQSPAAPELPGWQELTGETLPTADLIDGVVRHLDPLLNVEPVRSELPAAIRERAKQLEQDRYSSRSWTARR
jgi:lipoate-protein ligase A